MALVVAVLCGCDSPTPVQVNSNESKPKEIVFWHFWGGDDRAVVEDVARRFNASQQQHRVRPIAMPGNNLNAKLFLSVAGGDPPDLVNQDDPVLAQWASVGLIEPLDSIATSDEVAKVRSWLFPAAEALSVYDDRLYGVCNGLDIRALYVNQTALDQAKLELPTTLGQLDQIAEHFANQFDEDAWAAPTIGYLPDSRRLWAWAHVFGGQFYDEFSLQPTVDSPANVAALEWMSGHYERLGVDRAIAFRSGDQSLPGKAFPLLPIGRDQQVGRYVTMMDGQWRVRDIQRFLRQRKRDGLSAPEFRVLPLPTPGENESLTPRENAGWVNGNFFVVPKGAKNAAGAWAFIKFWIGIDDPTSAARTCAAGGWIPVSNEVVQTDAFQNYLRDQPLFRSFVDLAASESQFPTPGIPSAMSLQRTVNAAAYQAMTDPAVSAQQALQSAQREVQQSFDRVRSSISRRGSARSHKKNDGQEATP